MMEIPATNSNSSTKNSAVTAVSTGTMTSMPSSFGTLVAVTLAEERLWPLPGGKDLVVINVKFPSIVVHG